MKAPQLEDGYTQIANDIIEALAGIRISGEEMQCLWVIFRKIFGWGKKEDTISLGQFMTMTRIKKPNILRALARLLSKKIIIIKKDNDGNKIYIINKDLSEWNPLSKKITFKNTLSKKIKRVVKNDNRLSISGVKETVTKERINTCGFAKLWNKTINGNLPIIRRPDRLNNTRKAAIRKAWQYYDDSEDWRQIFKALSDSPHHQGQNDKGWVADFDWIMKPDNYPRFHDKSAMPKIQNQKPPAGGQVLSTYVGTHETKKERSPEDEELYRLKVKRTISKRDGDYKLTPNETARLEELEGAVI